MLIQGQELSRETISEQDSDGNYITDTIVTYRNIETLEQYKSRLQLETDTAVRKKENSQRMILEADKTIQENTATLETLDG